MSRVARPTKITSPAAPNANKAGAAGAVLLGGMFLIAAGSQIKLHVFEADSTVQLGEQTNRFTVTRIDKAKRGGIFTSDGKPLAEDADAYELTINFAKIPRTSAFALALSEATGIPATEFLALEKGSRTWPAAVSPKQAKLIQEVKSVWRADGVSLSRVGTRVYPFGELAASLVGSQQFQSLKDAKTGKPVSVVVRTGLESSKNRELTGTDGKQSGLADKDGSLLPLRSSPPETRRQDGHRIVTSLDSQIQIAASQAVRDAVVANKATSGVAVVVEPSTGRVLAMANWPSFDPENPTGASVGYNHATMSLLEPGSTFKILTLAKAIDQGQVRSDWRLNCGGEFHLNKFWRVRCDAHHGSRAHGLIDAEKAIAKSCNVAAAKWALGVGRDEFVGFLNALHLFEKTDLGLPGELGGDYNEKEYAKPLQLAQFGFGQSMTVTPTRLAAAFGMVANKGVYRAPRLVDSIGDVEVKPSEGDQVLSAATCERVMHHMEAVIESDFGTGKELRIPGYRLAGKTGTAQKVGFKGGGYVSNFVGMVPAKDPKAVVLVMIDNPKGGKYYGGSVAGPAFVRIARSVIDRYHIPPVGASTREIEVDPAFAGTMDDDFSADQPAVAETSRAGSSRRESATLKEAPVENLPDGTLPARDTVESLPLPSSRRAQVISITPEPRKVRTNLNREVRPVRSEPTRSRDTESEKPKPKRKGRPNSVAETAKVERKTAQKRTSRRPSAPVAKREDRKEKSARVAKSSSKRTATRQPATRSTKPATKKNSLARTKKSARDSRTLIKSESSLSATSASRFVSNAPTKQAVRKKPTPTSKRRELNLRDGDDSAKTTVRARSLRDDDAPKTKPSPRRRPDKKSPIEDPDR